MQSMNPDGEAFVARYEAFLKELSVAIKGDPMLAFSLFDHMKNRMAADFQHCLRAAVYHNYDEIRSRLEAEYRRELETLRTTAER